MRKILITICFLIPVLSYSQSYVTPSRQFEIGIGVGPVAYLGDIQGNKGKGTTFLKDLNPRNIQPVYGAFFTYYPDYGQSNFGFKLAFNFGKAHGADSLIVDRGSDEYFRLRRNLSFKTSFKEVYAAVEYYAGGEFFRPFVSAGIGTVIYNPTAEIDGQRYDLRPLALEGVNYSKTTISFPLGFGIKYYGAGGNILTVDLLYRVLATDYFDDVSTDYRDPSSFTGPNADISRRLAFRERSGRNGYAGEQRGDSKDNDAYFTLSARYSFLAKQNVGYLRRQSLRCPTIY